jgi:hypothetical protein
MSSKNQQNGIRISQTCRVVWIVASTDNVQGYKTCGQNYARAFVLGIFRD